jgi:hypothetical protein
MDKATRELVIERAGKACEYCQLPQSAQPFASFHVDHVIATQHQSDDGLNNLCLSCQSYNLHKGTNLTTIDLKSNEIVRVFDPRHERWDEHFEIVHFAVVGKTAIGRATARLLAMNTPSRIELRRLRGIGGS